MTDKELKGSFTVGMIVGFALIGLAFTSSTLWTIIQLYMEDGWFDLSTSLVFLLFSMFPLLLSAHWYTEYQEKKES